jgi:hypothetical protein
LTSTIREALSKAVTLQRMRTGARAYFDIDLLKRQSYARLAAIYRETPAERPLA